MHQFSIISPTYNRSKYLPAIFQCLNQQHGVDFEWVIVNDGSVDDTENIVNQLNNSPKSFTIKYIRQKNSGKPSAINTGMELADSYITNWLDDDDILLPGVLSEVWRYFDLESRRFENNCIVLSGLCIYDTGKIIGDKYHKDYFVSDHISYIHNRNIWGDKCEFVVTEILKKYPYTIFEDEKNIAPGLTWTRLAADNHETLYVNKIFNQKAFLEGGLSSQSYWYKYPKSSELFYNEATIPRFSLVLQIKHSSQYIEFARINKQRNIFSRALNKRIYPLGLCAYYYYLLKQFLKKIALFQELHDLIKSKESDKVPHYKKKITLDK
jgi:glycosyltransferase involved in cell wall biosynthesis